MKKLTMKIKELNQYMNKYTEYDKKSESAFIKAENAENFEAMEAMGTKADFYYKKSFQALQDAIECLFDILGEKYSKKVCRKILVENWDAIAETLNRSAACEK